MIFEFIMNKYESGFDAILRHVAWIESDKEDAKQDLALFLLENMFKYDSSKGAISSFVNANIKIFLRRFKSNIALEQRMEDKYFPLIIEEKSAEDPSYTVIEQSIDISLLGTKMIPRARKIFELLCEGLSYKEAASIMKMSLTQIHNIKNRYIEPIVEQCS